MVNIASDGVKMAPVGIYGALGRTIIKMAQVHSPTHPCCLHLLTDDILD